MNSHYTYLLIDFLTIIFPLFLSFDEKVAFYRQWRYLWIGLVVTGLFFIAWDALFAYQEVWSFNDAYILGTKFCGLPIEEWLFFLLYRIAARLSMNACWLTFPSGSGRIGGGN